MLRAIAGYDAADASTSVLPVPDYGAALTGDLKGLRVGLLRGFFLEGASPEVRAAVETAARVLAAAGAVVDDVSLDQMQHVAGASLAIVGSEALAYHAELLRTRAGEYDPEVARRLRPARTSPARTTSAASKLAPSCGTRSTRAGPARRAAGAEHADRRAPRRRSARSSSATASRMSARRSSGSRGRSISPDTRRARCRAGSPTAGLPIGMQFVGRPFDEATVLRAADAFQRLTDFHVRHPVLG